MRRFAATFSAVFLFVSIFANCFHSHHHDERSPAKFSCIIENQTAGIIAASDDNKDCDGDCAACSYLQVAQGAYFDNVYLPEKQAYDQYSVIEPKLFHNEICIEYPPRAPPYFIA